MTCVKCSYIEKELIPAVWTVSLIFVITSVFDIATIDIITTEIVTTKNIGSGGRKEKNSAAHPIEAISCNQ